MVDRLCAWSTELGVIKSAGVVMGAAHKDQNDSSKIFSWHLSRARAIVGNDMWFLIPGIGTQGGFVEETIRASFGGPGTIAINSSSGITNASSGADFAEAAGREAEKLAYQIRTAGGNC
jgi:orotidine-5'-phosphate decarboxylase